MINIKFKYTTDVIEKEKNLRFYRYSKHSILNLSIDKKRLFLYANVNQEFLDLHSIKTNRILIANDFEYINSKIYLIRVEILSKNETPKIKNILINLIDQLCKSYKVSKNDKLNVYRLLIRFSNFKTFDQIDSYLGNVEKAAA